MVTCEVRLELELPQPEAIPRPTESTASSRTSFRPRRLRHQIRHAAAASVAPGRNGIRFCGMAEIVGSFVGNCNSRLRMERRTLQDEGLDWALCNSAQQCGPGCANNQAGRLGGSVKT